MGCCLMLSVQFWMVLKTNNFGCFRFLFKTMYYKELIVVQITVHHSNVLGVLSLELITFESLGVLLMS